MEEVIGDTIVKQATMVNAAHFRFMDPKEELVHKSSC